MQQGQNSQFETYIQSEVQSLKNNVGQLFYLQSFDYAVKIYKSLCKNLIYLINCVRLALVKSQRAKSSLIQCSKIVKGMLKSSQYEYKGHIFPLLSNFLNKVQKIIYKKVQALCPQVLSQRIEKNESSRYYQSIQLSKIVQEEMDFLKLRNPNSFFIMLQNGQICLQNSQCVCCSQVFFKDWKVQNLNPFIHSVFSFQYKNTIDVVLLQRCVNAICNVGGGVILIGVQKKQSFFRVVGINADNLNEISQRQNQVRKAFHSSHPSYYYMIDRVAVQNNLFNSYKSEKQSRVCIRILILPYSLRQAFYLQHELKGHINFYELYQLDENEKPSRIDFTVNQKTNQMKSLYTFIHQKYKIKQSKRGKNSHQSINCFKPQSKNQWVSQQVGMKFSHSTSSHPQQSNFQQQIYEDEPKFKYPRTCLLVTTSKKNDRWILDFETQLKKKKKQVDFVKPFQKSFKEGVRSIWMMTYSKKFSELKQILAQLQKDEIILPGVIRMMPVSNVFSVQKDKLTKYHQNQFVKKFANRYSEVYEKQLITSTSKETKNLIYFTFNDFGQAIFAYMIFQQMQIRPYFQIGSNMKKAKPTSWNADYL